MLTERKGEGKNERKLLGNDVSDVEGGKKV